MRTKVVKKAKIFINFGFFIRRLISHVYGVFYLV